MGHQLPISHVQQPRRVTRDEAGQPAQPVQPDRWSRHHYYRTGTSLRAVVLRTQSVAVLCDTRALAHLKKVCIRQLRRVSALKTADIQPLITPNPHLSISALPSICRLVAASNVAHASTAGTAARAAVEPAPLHGPPRSRRRCGPGCHHFPSPGPYWPCGPDVGPHQARLTRCRASISLFLEAQI